MKYLPAFVWFFAVPACLFWLLSCGEDSRCHEVGDAVECVSPNGEVTCQEPGEDSIDYYPCPTDGIADQEEPIGPYSYDSHGGS